MPSPFRAFPREANPLNRVLTSLAAMVLIACCTAATVAQGQATVLDPISPITIRPLTKRPAIATDAQGNVMVVFWGKRDDESVLWSLLSSGGAWSDAEVPLPAGDDRWHWFDLYDLAGRSGQFALLLKNHSHNRSHKYYALWSGGSWSTPVEFPDDVEHPRELGFDASGNLLTWEPGTHSYLARMSGGVWQRVELPQRQETRYSSCPPNRLVLGRTGALHLLGETRRSATGGVLMVGSCPAGADPMQPSSWVYQPPGYDREHSGGPRLKHEVGYALDWPRQTVWMSWEGSGREDGGKIFVGHAPIGTTSEAGWVTWEIALQDGDIDEQQIACSGAGAAGVAYKARVNHQDELYFRWLPPNGPGEPIQIARPGSQTEAADFRQLYNGTLAMCVGADGTAHVVIKGKKRGEYPENAERLYYSRVTGGAVLQTEPGVTGGATEVAGGQPGGEQTGGQQTDWQQQGGKPDLLPALALDDALAYERDG